MNINYYYSIVIVCSRFYTLESADFLCSKNIDLSRVFTQRFSLSVILTPVKPDMDDLLPVKDLSYEKWKVKVLSKVDNELVKACLVCIERMRIGEELSQTEKEYVKCAINSFSVLGRFFESFFIDYTRQ